MIYKCLIVDDEPLAIKLIENHILQIGALEVVATCNNALKAFEILNTNNIDLLFIDIKMPNISGIDFLKSLKNPPKTILTTAYRDFAIDGFEVGVVDYLLKPITFERFFKAIDKFLKDNKKKEYKIPNLIKMNSYYSNQELKTIESTQVKSYILKVIKITSKLF